LLLKLGVDLNQGLVFALVVMKTQLSKPAKWSSNGESFSQFHVVSGAPTDQDLDELFKSRCHCSHDCCGHTHTYVSLVREINDDQVAVIQRGFINV
tara:strand:- start:822 stop:1109 length:288 start_codon:yes stop_codon:yes gene_type:complete